MWEVFAIGIIAVIGYLEYWLGTSFVGRPIVTGALVGLALGDLTQGVIIGGTLELVWLGLMGVGASPPPDYISGGILGTAIAIQSGGGVDVALVVGLPVATLMLILKNFMIVFWRTACLHWADALVDRGRYTLAGRMHHISVFVYVLVMASVVAIGFAAGSDAVRSLLDVVPAWVTDGMRVATMMLPALGFAMLIQMILNRQVAPFFFIGFVLAAYLGIPVLGIAILGACLGAVMFIILTLTEQRSMRTAGGLDEF